MGKQNLRRMFCLLHVLYLLLQPSQMKCYAEIMNGTFLNVKRCSLLDDMPLSC
ncbi:hypothetical protein PF005_g16860 [Phytophthora fragariae]|uniref:Uncharacterized protein n=1 Tax=Phytophthora fragariae TaxID=53985 RepID=A0A6A3R1D5_9STRA|nr:hypothetical protein PF003_g15521 [Phytophthora fragariae]KAE8932177.1 hypothetical protein PF009_g17775 [Phytophthora fragariae]KAE8979275.1 hypothetical protein PF011_g22919 [Phytophthora fragariae]KAE9086725.1 hypothetical protein PF007_g20658 [Phytophthora fragariae]KAE9097635.1 hypothetical protein PF010_g15877 [Phytophthora fragariae]